MIWASQHWVLAHSDQTILLGFLGQELFQDQAEVGQWCKKNDHLWVWRVVHLGHRLWADKLKPWSPRHPCYDDSPLHLPLGTAELCMLHSTGSIPGSIGLFPKSHQTQSRVSSPGLCSKNELYCCSAGKCAYGASPSPSCELKVTEGSGTQGDSRLSAEQPWWSIMLVSVSPISKIFISVAEKAQRQDLENGVAFASLSA